MKAVAVHPVCPKMSVCTITLSTSLDPQSTQTLVSNVTVTWKKTQRLNYTLSPVFLKSVNLALRALSSWNKKASVVEHASQMPVFMRQITSRIFSMRERVTLINVKV